MFVFVVVTIMVWGVACSRVRHVIIILCRIEDRKFHYCSGIRERMIAALAGLNSVRFLFSAIEFIYR